MLSGMLIPVSWFPGWLAAIARATPFPSMLQAPADLLTGRIHETSRVLQVLATQLVWVAVLMGVAQLTVLAATRKLVVQGG